MKKLDVRIIGPIYDISGISNNLREFSIALSEIGTTVQVVDVNSSPFKVILDQTTAQKLDIMTKTQISENYVSIHMTPPERMTFIDDKAKANICWSAYDTDKLPLIAALLLSNKNVNEIWVPSTGHSNIYAASGLNKDKIKVVSWGVDSVNYQSGNQSLAEIKEKDSFYFSFIGSLKATSGFDVVLRAFYDEFSNDTNVKLIFKAFIGKVEADKEKEFVKNVLSQYKKESKAEVVYIPGNLSTEIMNRLYHTADCFVSVPRAKAWGTGIIKSMSAGVPIITNVNTGNKAYTTHSNARLITSTPAKIMNIDWLLQNPIQQEHAWFEPSVDELKKAMREMYDMRDSAEHKEKIEAMKKSARSEALKRDWKKIALEVINNIRQYGDKE